MSTLAMIAAHVPLERLREHLVSRVGPIELTTESIPASSIQDDAVGFGEEGGDSFVVDGELMLTAVVSPDAIVSLSRELNTTVVYLIAQRMMGIADFVAAKDGELLRYFNTSVMHEKPLSLGAPLPSEATTPIDTMYDGVIAAAESLGFSVSKWLEDASVRTMTNDVEMSEESSEKGTLHAAYRAHQSQHVISADEFTERLQPKVEGAYGGFTMALALKPKPAPNTATTDQQQSSVFVPTLIVVGLLGLIYLIVRFL